MPVNLIDKTPIDRYLESVLPSNPEAARLLKLALSKPLAKRQENMAVITKLPTDAPPWLREKWPEGGPYHRFEADPALNHKVRHVADWIEASIVENDGWLNELDTTDPNQKPHKLKFGSLEDAVSAADIAMKARNKRLAAQLVADDSGERTVAAMPDGFRMVQLLTPEALDRESLRMGHCIGQGSYDQFLVDEKRRLFSLRDNRNEPHATLEVDTGSNTLLQCQGKENKPVVQKYHKYLLPFIRSEDVSLPNNMANELPPFIHIIAIVALASSAATSGYATTVTDTGTCYNEFSQRLADCHAEVMQLCGIVVCNTFGNPTYCDTSQGNHLERDHSRTLLYTCDDVAHAVNECQEAAEAVLYRCLWQPPQPPGEGGGLCDEDGGMLC